MKGKYFVLWQFIGIATMKSGKPFLAKDRACWKQRSKHTSIDAAIASIDDMLARCRSRLDGSWVITYDGKVVFSDISDRGYILNIFIDDRFEQGV